MGRWDDPDTVSIAFLRFPVGMNQPKPFGHFLSKLRGDLDLHPLVGTSHYLYHGDSKPPSYLKQEACLLKVHNEGKDPTAQGYEFTTLK